MKALATWNIPFHHLKVLHCLTSVFRPSKDVRMPRMEFRPTSLASSGSWDEYCSMSFKILAASWMVWIGAWDYRVASTYIENGQKKYIFCCFIDNSGFMQEVHWQCLCVHVWTIPVWPAAGNAAKKGNVAETDHWSFPSQAWRADRAPQTWMQTGAHVENTQIFFYPFLQIRSSFNDRGTLCHTIFLLWLLGFWQYLGFEIFGLFC